MKKYGDVVTYVRNSVELNALVLQSTIEAEEAGAKPSMVAEPKPGKECLLLAYLDPAAASNTIHSVSTTAATAFSVKPMADGAVNGWKELAPDRIEGSPREVVEAVQYGAASEEIARLRKDLSDANESIADLKEQLAAEKAKPTAADLDSHAADEEAKQATGGGDAGTDPNAAPQQS